MRRPDAHRVWLGYCAVEAFAFGLGWTVAPIFFVRELGLSPLELVLAGTALELAYFAFEIPTGIVADIYGRRRSMIIGVLGLGLGFVGQGMLLVVSGVYYPVSVLPNWMEWLSTISPATYALRGIRASILDGAGIAWADVWPLLVIGVFSIPLGLWIFSLGERHAKKHGKLKRSG